MNVLLCLLKGCVRIDSMLRTHTHNSHLLYEIALMMGKISETQSTVVVEH